MPQRLWRPAASASAKVLACVAAQHRLLHSRTHLSSLAFAPLVESSFRRLGPVFRQKRCFAKTAAMALREAGGGDAGGIIYKSIRGYSGRARKERVKTWAPEPQARVPMSMAVLARNAELTLPYRQVGANIC